MTAGRTTDARFMRVALRLARRGVGRTSPNPPVGAVIVAKSAIVGRGYHRKAGEPHAEVAALRDAGGHARGGTLYVTLEPCAHHGRTPPCTDAIIAAGLRRVVVGTCDPNPSVCGDGTGKLRQAGIHVTTGMEQAACDALIAAFRKHITTGMPWVTLKLAASLDGRIATVTGESRWITGADSRRFVHRLRAEHDAVLVGAETVRHDDPALTCRMRGGRNPLRVVLDGRLRIPLQAQVLTTTDAAETLVVAGRGAPARKGRSIEALGASVLRLPDRAGRIPLSQLLRALGRRGVLSVLIEGGASVAAAAIAARVVDRVLIFYAPTFIGGDGRPMLGPIGVRRLATAPSLRPPRLRRFATDVLVATEMVRTHDRSTV
ncbi:MAG: riboflavin biosynthesis protein RibD [Deltaproteobacteria bacterium]|nr:riboflavin biosynthesis protein RibD [Deltaproteobacteria bacterium]